MFSSIFSIFSLHFHIFVHQKYFYFLFLLFLTLSFLHAFCYRDRECIFIYMIDCLITSNQNVINTKKYKLCVQVSWWYLVFIWYIQKAKMVSAGNSNHYMGLELRNRKSGIKLIHTVFPGPCYISW